ncbi:MAG: NAD-dependent epimerase/dehydratase family protein [Polyangiaceae bacterium]|nr:NAD-dependent epimerase/dehydratase family protein [Polyangiaceae bacterium]
MTPPATRTPDGRVPSVLVTGATGYLGSLTLAALAERRAELGGLVGVDVRAPASVPAGVTWRTASVTDSALGEWLRAGRIDTVVHLASILKPPRDGGDALAYQVDVEGTRNVLAACASAGVRKLILTTSGAAYGYYPDNPAWITEDAPIRGNPEIAYAFHKRLIEADLARHRRRHPELAQLVFRPGTVIGPGVSTPVTALFEAPVVLGVLGSESPFVMIWDADVVACLVRGIFGGATGTYNLAGDGALPPREIARRLRKPYVPVPAAALRATLAALQRLGRSAYGPEHVDFLRYRPVLSNRALKERFGYAPRKTSREAFELWASAREGRPTP